MFLPTEETDYRRYRLRRGKCIPSRNVSSLESTLEVEVLCQYLERENVGTQPKGGHKRVKTDKFFRGSITHLRLRDCGVLGSERGRTMSRDLSVSFGLKTSTDNYSET